VSPDLFRTFPCPTYPEIRLAWLPGKKMRQLIDAYDPDCLHIATEGPLGWAARKVALLTGRAFTTAFHTRFPEYVKARSGIPLAITYAILRRFHAPSKGVMVATDSIAKDLNYFGITNLRRWSRGVDFQRFNTHVRALDHSLTVLDPTASQSGAKRPVFLFAGRVAVEKNIEAFLKLDLPGEKWVAGDGPQKKQLASKYPDVRWLGMLDSATLSLAYQQADVFVFPSLTDTFGLVLLEAMACGLPVAAFPVAGPKDVVGESGAGALNMDLQAACLAALSIPRERVLAHARMFTWENATTQFLNNLRIIDKGYVENAVGPRRLARSLALNAPRS
jgi:glycosyltransferase involved in cell wall biosynthesis